MTRYTIGSAQISILISLLLSLSPTTNLYHPHLLKTFVYLNIPYSKTLSSTCIPSQSIWLGLQPFPISPIFFWLLYLFAGGIKKL
ncbi:uncharacterized protein ASCRUDRAFT_127085 [Ascoidea rubescens DSM 1968]|uniref:Uncharacterized protein n=1 Tax=Ascoidea rubescens DSM 1968 TaxID=1344418 RepID=A0A1D2VNA9_9ASCO|nr:hypothetical protein ASCRUDRAFT_127085 [Ascoidea rubescens DSM 1968]ODV63093.1 hypothetical protein ASCRUDRAFT_127085 [Ascoidea rubescens DSM 1968]